MAVLLLIALLTGNSVCSGNNGETISLLLESCKGPQNGSTAKSSKSSDRVSKSQGFAPSPGPSSTNARNALLEADFRILGPAVVPLTSQKQNAIIVGVANVLGDGILASDIILTVTATYNVST